MVVLLGTPAPEASELYAVTVTEGDPSWAGVLAGTAYGLPVYHISEPEIKEQVDPALYDQEIGVAEMVLEVDLIREAVKKIRDRSRDACSSPSVPSSRHGPGVTFTLGPYMVRFLSAVLWRRCGVY